MIQIMACNDLVFYTFIVQLNCMVSVVTAELKEVFNYKLIVLAPTNLEPSLLKFQCCWSLYSLGIEQIKYLLIVNLQKGAMNLNSLTLALLSLFENLPNGSNSQPHFAHRSIDIDLASPLITLSFLIFVAFHRISLSRSRLTICKDSSVVTFNDLRN